MDIFKKLMVLVVFLIVLYILYRLIEKRRQLLLKEGFVKELSDITNTNVTALSSSNKTPNTITNMPDSYKSRTLQSMFIKASFDTAYDGQTVSTDMVQYILSRGYRFLDFEVYFEPLTTEPDSSPTVTVAVSEFGTYPRTSTNNILLTDVFKTIQLNAFNASSPNPNDPLFIQLRPMYQPAEKDTEDTTEAYRHNSQLNATIKQALDVLNQEYMFQGSLSGSTKLKDISATSTSTAKVVLVMDLKRVNKGDDLIPRIHLTQNNVMNVFLPEDTPGATLAPMAGPRVGLLTQVHPFAENNVLLPYNLNPYKTVSLVSPNIMPVLAWYPNTNVVLYNNMGESTLAIYEKLFIKNGNSAFVEMSALKRQAEDEIRINSNRVTA